MAVAVRETSVAAPAPERRQSTRLDGAVEYLERRLTREAEALRALRIAGRDTSELQFRFAELLRSYERLSGYLNRQLRP